MKWIDWRDSSGKIAWQMLALALVAGTVLGGIVAAGIIWGIVYY